MVQRTDGADLAEAFDSGLACFAPTKGEPIRILDDQATAGLGELLDRIAPSDLNVLILGETGAGKEVVAEEIHRRSSRASKPFVRLNCAAIHQPLLESELFGHERGAFTGAVSAKPGLLESAHGGTVLLDEVGELPPATQVSLLRVIEERQVRRVGSVQPRAVDVRFVSATNRNIEVAITEGRFRNDLYFRLNGVSLDVPPLRMRHDAIGRLLDAYGNRARRGSGLLGPVRFTDEATDLLERWRWPGNVRELRNVVERAVLMAGDAPIGPEHLPTDIAAQDRSESTVSEVELSARPTAPPPPPRGEFDTADTSEMDDQAERGGLIKELRDRLAELERQRIVEALAACGGNQTEAARLLGISRRTLVYRLGQYDIPRPRKSSGSR